MRSHEQHRHSPRVVQQVSHAILRQRRVHEQEGASCALRNQLTKHQLGTLLGHDRDDWALLWLLCGRCSCRCLQPWNVIICSVQERLQRDGLRRAGGLCEVEQHCTLEISEKWSAQNSSRRPAARLGNLKMYRSISTTSSSKVRFGLTVVLTDLGGRRHGRGLVAQVLDEELHRQSPTAGATV
jgi:hypothetical protein